MPRSTSAHKLDEHIHREDSAQGAQRDLAASRRRVIALIDDAIVALSDPAFARDVAELRALAMEAEEAPWSERLGAILDRAEAIVIACAAEAGIDVEDARPSGRMPLPPHESGTYARSPIRRVLTRPDPLLARAAMRVDPTADHVVRLAHELVATMRSSPACVGLAANQIGEAAHLFCMDVTGHKKARTCAGLVVLANARVVARSKDVVLREGCLSVPHLTGNVARAAEVVVEGEEPGTGRIVRVRADAIEARCLQHELDHLGGMTFVDRVRSPERDLFERKTYA